MWPTTPAYVPADCKACAEVQDLRLAACLEPQTLKPEPYPLKPKQCRAAGAVAALGLALVPFYTGKIIDFATIDQDADAFKRTTLKLVCLQGSEQQHTSPLCTAPAVSHSAVTAEAYMCTGALRGKQMHSSPKAECGVHAEP